MGAADEHDERYELYYFEISYFSGKMQAYLRYKEIPHRPIEVSWWQLNRRIYPATGLMKVPVIRTPAGEWLQDTTPMIDWFEERVPGPPVVPPDPYQAFFSRLVEDYADEWMWRPALHYRWSYREDSHALSRRFLRDFLHPPPGTGAGYAAFVRERQRRIYVRGDGVCPETRADVERVYLETLDHLEGILADRPFLLGGRPTLADLGFFASMYRHFALDPTPARIMRERAPGVRAWVDRVWNARASDLTDAELEPDESTPDTWSPVLRDVGRDYLPYLLANARAWRDGADRFDFTASTGVTYRDLPVVQYRVWCRERLQDHLTAVPDGARALVERTLDDHGALEPLRAEGRIESHLHDEGPPPVCRPVRVSLLDGALRYLGGTHWNRPDLRRTPESP